MSKKLSFFKGDATKLNSSVLRGIEGSTLHFITIPRNSDSEYIDQVCRIEIPFIFHFNIFETNELNKKKQKTQLHVNIA